MPLWCVVVAVFKFGQGEKSKCWISHFYLSNNEETSLRPYNPGRSVFCSFCHLYLTPQAGILLMTWQQQTGFTLIFPSDWMCSTGMTQTTCNPWLKIISTHTQTHTRSRTRVHFKMSWCNLVRTRTDQRVRWAGNEGLSDQSDQHQWQQWTSLIS